MALRFCFPSGEVMPVHPGLPARYNGLVLKGAQASHAFTDIATIIDQEYNNLYFSVNVTTINWLAAERIICEYDFPLGILTRIPIDNPIHEKLKGAGEFDLSQNQFCIVAGSSWKGALLPHQGGTHAFLTLQWSAEFVKETINEFPAIALALSRVLTSLPVLVLGPANFVNSSMTMLVEEMFALHLDGKRNVKELGVYLKNYFLRMLTEWFHFDPYKRKMRESDWITVHEARKLIDANILMQYTTAEISKRIGMNEHKLKKLFPKITGFPLEDYRKCQLNLSVARKLVRNPDDPIKTYYPESGFSNMQNFSRAFPKYCCCRPTEIRQDTWNINGIVHNKFNEV